MPRVWSARIRSARSVSNVSPYRLPLSSSPSAISGANWSVSNTDCVPCRIDAMRLRPMPVSMFCAGSGVSTPSGSWSYCMNTRFQYSRKRSFSPPGRSSSLPNSSPRSRYSSEHGPQGPVGPACQKFSERGSSTIRSRGTPIFSHASIASSSGPMPSASSPSKTVAQISSGSNPKPWVESSHANSAAPCLK